MSKATGLTAVAMLAMAFCIGTARAGDEEKHGGPSAEQREQMREKCKANPEQCKQMMKERAEAHFKKIDTDGDGSISKSEAQANAPRIAEHFDQIDADHDGKVTKEELHAARKAMMEKRHAAKEAGKEKQ